MLATVNPTRVVVVLAAVLALGGAFASAARPSTAAQPAPAPVADVQPVTPATQPAADTQVPPPTTQPQPTSDVARDADKQARERERKLARLRRQLEIAQLGVAKARIALEHGDLKYNDALAAAETEFELAKKRLQIFQKMTVPNRLARAELELRQVEDGVTESQEELYQLELMYSAEQLADQTREIVIERAKRRLERAQRDLELRREEFRVLKEVSLPLEEQELDHAAELKKRAVLQTQRDNEPEIIDRKVAVINAELEVTRLEEEIADLVAEAQAAASQPAR